MLFEWLLHNEIIFPDILLLPGLYCSEIFEKKIILYIKKEKYNKRVKGADFEIGFQFVKGNIKNQLNYS